MKYDAVGRPVLSTDWSAISNIPPDVDFWATFPPPSQDSLLYYDFGLGQIQWVPNEAQVIWYDNTASGLSAVNVQDAIDEVVTLVQSVTSIFSGWVSQDASASDLPSGWSVTNIGGGIHTITHNLGLSAVTDLRIVLTWRGSGDDDVSMGIPASTANAFNVHRATEFSGGYFFIAVLK